MAKTSLIFSLAFQVNAAVDAGGIHVTAEEMKEILKNERLFRYLEAYPRDFNIGSTGPADREYLTRNLRGTAMTREGRTLGVGKNGLCLLLACLLDLAQRSLGNRGVG